MGQPVKLSDELVCAARASAEIAQRSIAGQIELWAALGDSLERLPHVLVLDNSDVSQPYQLVEHYRDGKRSL